MTAPDWVDSFKVLLDKLDRDQTLSQAEYLEILDEVAADADERAQTRRERMEGRE